MVELDSVISYCHKRLFIDSIIDFENAQNGLQLENNGTVTKIAASVDAGLIPIQQASKVNADLLLCHHGLFWSPITPIRDHNYKKIKMAITGNGNASKEQVARMLQSLLGLKTLPKNLDSTDGLAAAVCHYFNMGKSTTQKSYGSWESFVSQNKDRIKK